MRHKFLSFHDLTISCENDLRIRAQNIRIKHIILADISWIIFTNKTEVLHNWEHFVLKKKRSKSLQYLVNTVILLIWFLLPQSWEFSFLQSSVNHNSLLKWLLVWYMAMNYRELFLLSVTSFNVSSKLVSCSSSLINSSLVSYWKIINQPSIAFASLSTSNPLSTSITCTSPACIPNPPNVLNLFPGFPW